MKPYYAFLVVTLLVLFLLAATTRSAVVVTTAFSVIMSLTLILQLTLSKRYRREQRRKGR